MRISTNAIYQQGLAGMQRQQTDLVRTQQQMSQGTRMLSPSDDPVAAARVLLVEQASATNEQYKVNRGAARSALGIEEGVLASIGDLLQQVRTSVVYAGNPTLTNSDRAMLVTELNSRFQELMGLANSTDGAGLYLFSGYQGATRPYSGAPGGVTYSGDQGQRLLQAGATRQIPVSDSGADVFERIKTGNGAFFARAAAANTGTGVVGPGAVINPAAQTGHSYEIRFNVVAGVTTYDVVDTTTGAAVPAPAAAGNPYTEGGTITFDGMQLDVKGVPADKDKFVVTPSTSQSVFRTMSDIIAAIGAQVVDPAGSARLANAINTGLSNLDRALDNVLSVRADVGARLNELDSLDKLGEDMALQYSGTVSELKDLDYAAAASDLTRQKVLLEAAQKSFTKITGMSLFDFI